MKKASRSHVDPWGTREEVAVQPDDKHKLTSVTRDIIHTIQVRKDLDSDSRRESCSSAMVVYP